MLVALLEALFIVLMLGMGLVAALQIAALYLFPRDRRRALPFGHHSGRVTTQDIDQANRATLRDREAVAAFNRAQLAAGGASC